MTIKSEVKDFHVDISLINQDFNSLANIMSSKNHWKLTKVKQCLYIYGSII